MGMYTELALGVAFKKDTPPDVLYAIDRMVCGDASVRDITESIRSHPLFSTQRWGWMLRSDGSCYFAAPPVVRFDNDEFDCRLAVWTNIKNYSGEWANFLDFIGPHVKGRGHVGHMRHEESEHPTLLYARNGRIHMVKPEVDFDIWADA